MYVRTYLLLSQRKSAMSAKELKCIFGWVIRTSTTNNSLSLPHLSLMEGLEGGRVAVGPHTPWIAIKCVLVSLVLDDKRTEITSWLTDIIR